MVRPKTKDELLVASEKNFEALLALTESFSEEEQLGTFPFSDRDRNIRDVYVHLYEWHQLFLHWVRANLKNSEKITSFFPEPYNWKNYPELNVKFWQQHQETSLAEAKNLLTQSHEELMMLLTELTNEELFTKKYYPFTNTTSLGSYAVSATSSHYDWGIKKIRQYQKSLKKKRENKAEKDKCF